MSNAVQKYVSNKICCISNNLIKTDNKVKYGSSSANCCINKDFMVNVFIKMLMCNPLASDDTWYKVTYKGLYTDTIPTSFPGTVVIHQEREITSNDGQITGTFTFNTTSIQATSILDLNLQLAQIYKNIIISDPSIRVNIKSVNKSTGEMTIDVLYTSKWGNENSAIVTPLDSLFITPNIGSTFTAETPEEITFNSDSCFTSEQLCAMKRVIDNYCKSCN